MGKRFNFSLFPCLATSEFPYQELGATVVQNRCLIGHWMPLGPQIIQEGCTLRAVVSMRGGRLIVGSCQPMGPNRDGGKSSGGTVPVPRTGLGLGHPKLRLCLGYSKDTARGWSEGNPPPFLWMLQRRPQAMFLRFSFPPALALSHED